MSATDLDLSLSEIPELSKTKGHRLLAAAVRESQGLPRANYKDHCPSWWQTDRRVILSNGGCATTVSFRNPKDMKLDAILAVLHLYVVSKTQPEQEETAYGEEEEDPINPDSDDNANDNFTVQPASSSSSRRKKSPREKSININNNDEADEISAEMPAASSSVQPKRSPRLKKLARRNKKEPVINVEEDEAAEDSEEQAVSSKSLRRKRSPREVVAEVIDDSPPPSPHGPSNSSRIDFIKGLKHRRAELEALSKRILVAKEVRRTKTESDMRESLATALLLLDTKYSNSLMHIPRALQQVSMRDIVERYGMSQEKWLHDNVSRAVERALRDNGLGKIKKRKKPTAADRVAGRKGKDKKIKKENQDEEDNHGIDDDDNMDVINKENEDDDNYLAKTPPAQTPAARKCRDDVQKTISRTMRRVRLERKEDIHIPRHLDRLGRDDASGVGISAGTNNEREVGDVVAALGFQIDGGMEGNQVVNALTKTVKRTGNPLRLIGDIERWCQDMKEQLQQDEDDENDMTR